MTTHKNAALECSFDTTTGIELDDYYLSVARSHLEEPAEQEQEQELF